MRIPSRLLTRRNAVRTAIAVSIAADIALLSVGETGAVLLSILGVVVLAAMRRRAARDDDLLGAVMLLAYAIRLAVIAAISVFGLVTGRGPFLVGDEYGYFGFAKLIAYFLRTGLDPRAVLFGELPGASPYVDVQAVLLLALGDQAAVMKVVNSVLSVATGYLGYIVSRALFGRSAGRVAAISIVYFPTLLLWSVANLRESWVVFLLVGLVWCLDRLRATRSWVYVALGIYALALIEGIRANLYYVAGTIFPVATFLELRGAAWQRRVGFTVVAVVVGTGLLMNMAGRGFFGLDLLRPSTLTFLESERSFMATGARSAFAPELDDRTPVAVLQPGQPVQIQPPATPSPSPTPFPTPSPTPPPATTAPAAPAAPAAPTPTRPPATPAGGAVAPPPSPSATPSPTPVPTPTPCPSVGLTVVQPGQRVILLTPDATTPPAQPDRVYVRPCDMIVLGSPHPSAVPTTLVLPTTPPPRPASAAPTSSSDVSLPFGRPTVVGSAAPILPSFEQDAGIRVESAEPADLASRLRRILGSTLQGLPYVIAAPFPLFTRTGYELWFVPEIVAWVILLAAAAWTLVRQRSRWRELFMLGALSISLLLLLGLVEGNVGTLVRHRAMLIPSVLLLAAPTVAGWLRLPDVDREEEQRT